MHAGTNQLSVAVTARVGGETHIVSPVWGVSVFGYSVAQAIQLNDGLWCAWHCQGSLPCHVVPPPAKKSNQIRFQLAAIDSDQISEPHSHPSPPVENNRFRSVSLGRVRPARGSVRSRATTTTRSNVGWGEKHQKPARGPSGARLGLDSLHLGLVKTRAKQLI